MKQLAKRTVLSTLKHRKAMIGYLLMFTFAVSNLACKKPIPASTIDGYATGKVTDTKGKPMQGIEVIVENTLVGHHTYASGISDVNGNYKVKLPTVGTFHASAYVKRQFDGKTFDLPLHPSNNQSFSNEGAVVNFQWKLSGPMPTENEGFYGGSAYIYNHPGRIISDEYNIEFTLTPIGTLIDGSTGTTIVRKSGVSQSVSYGRLLDIPIGQYKVTATYLTGGQKVPLTLRVVDSSTPYTTAMTLDFEPSSTAGKNTASIQYYY